MKFSFLDLILFTGIIQGIFLIISLYFISQKNKQANKILMIIIGLSTLVFAKEMLGYLLNPLTFWRTSVLTESSMYLFGPLLYMYFRTLVFRHHPKNKLSFKHYIPSLILLLYFFWTFSLTTKEYVALNYKPIMYFVYLAMELTGVISFIAYGYLSYKITVHIKKEAHTTLYTRKIARYINFTLVGIILIAICWSYGIYNIYILQNYGFIISYKLIWITITVFLFVIGYFSFTQPEIVRMPIEKKKVAKSRLNAAEIEDISTKLTKLIEEEKVYMQSNLNLKILAKKLHTSPNNISWLLNSIHEKTFYEYINEYRVKAFLQKIENGEHKKQTLISIAMDAGFNSKSTFNKTFKSLMNDTPSSYIEKMYS